MPHIQVTLGIPCSLSHLFYPDYLTTPFIQSVDEVPNSRLLKLPGKHKLSQLLTDWELS